MAAIHICIAAGSIRILVVASNFKMAYTTLRGSDSRKGRKISSR